MLVTFSCAVMNLIFNPKEVKKKKKFKFKVVRLNTI